MTKSTITESLLVNGNLGEAVLPDTSGTSGSNFFELRTRCFYFSPETRALLSLKANLKMAPAWSRTAFFCGPESRHEIETNAFFKMQLRIAQNPVFAGIYLNGAERFWLGMATVGEWREVFISCCKTRLAFSLRRF